MIGKKARREPNSIFNPRLVRIFPVFYCTTTVETRGEIIPTCNHTNIELLTEH